MKMKILLIIIFLFVISFGLRIYQIDKVPSGLSNDEIAFGYNAYSILKIGKDQYGATYPLSFRSNNDYKLPGLVYSIAVTVFLFGNNELAVRLPSVLAGSLTIIVLFFLAKELTGSTKISLWSAFLLTISPWHVYTSRVAFDSNVALLFVCLGTLFFLLGFKKSFFFPISSFMYVLSAYFYHAQWVFTPLFILSLLIIYRDKVKRSKKNILFSFFVYILFFVPLALNYLNIMNTSTRINTENILKDPQLGIILSQYGNNILSKVLLTITFWINHYLSYLNPSFLFFNGLPVPSDYSLQRFGLFLILLAPFYVYGIYETVKKGLSPKTILIWFILAPLIPSLTLGLTSIERNVVQVIPIIILISLGLTKFLEKYKIKFFWQTILIIVLISNFALFYYTYIRHFSVESAENWSYGQKQIAQIIENYPDKHVILDPVFGTGDRTIYGVPHLYITFFNKEDPNLLINAKQKDEAVSFGRYTIKPVNWWTEKLSPNTIYVVRSQDVLPKGYPAKEISHINLPNNEEAFKIYLTD